MVRRLRCPSAAVLGCGVDERPLQVGEDPNQQGQYEEDSQRDLRELVDVIHANSLIGVSLSPHSTVPTGCYVHYLANSEDVQ